MSDRIFVDEMVLLSRTSVVKANYKRYEEIITKLQQQIIELDHCRDVAAKAEALDKAQCAKIAELERERDMWMTRCAGAISLLPADMKCGDLQRAAAACEPLQRRCDECDKFIEPRCPTHGYKGFLTDAP